jgi:hypothetical protein
VTPNDSLSQAPDPQAALNLRPLSIGELLDRAFNLYFQHVAVFTGTVAIVIIPSLIISYFQSAPILNWYINLVQHQIAAPNSTPDLSKLAALQPSDAWLGLQWAIVFLGLPFAYAAVVAAVSRAYLGLPITFAGSYRYALRRWLPILILVIVWGVALVVTVFVMALFFGFTVAIVAVATRAAGNNLLFGISSTIFVIGAMLAAVCVGIMLYLTFALSFISVVIEDVDPIKAFSTAFGRMFGSGQFWRGFVFALALTGIQLGAVLVGGGGGALLAYIFKSPALYVILAGMVNLFFAPFAVVAAAVFYYDIRIRREGYDLQMLVQRFLSGPVPAPPAQ